MGSISSSSLHQKAILWTANGYDDDGEHKVSAAVEVDVRWEEGRQETIDPQGNTIAIDAIVYINQEVAIGGVMWLGELADVPDTPTNLKEVVSYTQIPDIKNRNTLYAVSLMKLSNELPTIAT